MYTGWSHLKRLVSTKCSMCSVFLVYFVCFGLCLVLFYFIFVFLVALCARLCMPCRFQCVYFDSVNRHKDSIFRVLDLSQVCKLALRALSQTETFTRVVDIV